MADLRFEWDDAKNAANKKKHGVPFEEARSVFYDERALLKEEPDDSHGEDRFVLRSASSTNGGPSAENCSHAAKKS